MPERPSRPPLRPEDVLTQYGRQDATGFRNRPRPGVEEAISVIAGRLTAAEAHRLVIRRGAYRPAFDVVRYTTVAALSEAGFRLERNPTPAIPDHVVVFAEGEWGDEVAQRFDSCFGMVANEET
jgi:hypothetical protein